jgi:peptide/nickel transport system permease protein
MTTPDTSAALPFEEQASARERIGSGPRAVGRFLVQKKLGGLGLVVVFFFVIITILSGVVDRYEPDFIFDRDNPGFLANPTIPQLAADPDIGSPRVVDQFISPSSKHWFGTDKFGRDIYSRVIHGTKLSLIIGFGSSLIAVVAGLIIGVVSAYYLGWLDLIIQRAVDAVYAFPFIVLILLIVQIAEPSTRNVVIALGFGGIPFVTRLVRSATLSVRSTEYVQAARVIGATDMRIMVRHVLPNIGAVMIIAFSIGIGAFILAEATISFLGAGPRGEISWGKMVSTGRAALDLHPWESVFAGSAITLLVMAFNLLGDAMRDVLDPRLRGR